MRKSEQQKKKHLKNIKYKEPREKKVIEYVEPEVKEDLRKVFLESKIRAHERNMRGRDLPSRRDSLRKEGMSLEDLYKLE